MPRGLLLLNLGTPDSPAPADVRRYLAEFLMDPYVVDIPWIARWFLIYGVILRRRPHTSSEAYKKVWTEHGSPLLVHLRAFVEKIASRMGPEWVVLGAMRYQNPSVAAALEDFALRGIDDITVFPLYPQYSLAATKSSEEYATRIARRVHPRAKLRFVPAFYEDEGFIAAFAERGREAMTGFDADHVLFSFHGLPERHMRKTDRSGGAHCLRSESCCDRIVEANRDCYRAQCFATARALARALKLEPSRYSVSFQSRLGRTPWIRPYTDVLYQELPKRGVKHLLVFCPAFVADCLETLEEIEIRGVADFKRFGGEELKLVPSLNASDAWVEAAATLAARA